MNRGLVAAVMVGAALAAVAPLSAHHSFAATYYEDKTVTIEGDLVQFVFRNPHSYVHLEAPDENRQMERWAVEWGSGMQLSTQGLSATALKAGDHVIITGAPGRNSDDHRLRMRSITRPKDGFTWNGTFK
ncbi:MAG TPA: DUF6152 family protein [Vicinamibacterales bacterium]|jgi:hypothetical protein|nr:DUF6152 family protein [Vicinamibacterales bacterium]